MVAVTFCPDICHDCVQAVQSAFLSPVGRRQWIIRFEIVRTGTTVYARVGLTVSIFCPGFFLPVAIATVPGALLAGCSLQFSKAVGGPMNLIYELAPAENLTNKAFFTV